MSYSRENTEFKQEFKDVKDNVNEKKATQSIKRITTSELQRILEIYDEEKGIFTKLFGDDSCIENFRAFVSYLPNSKNTRDLTLPEATKAKELFDALRKRKLGSKTAQFIFNLNQKHESFWFIINNIFYDILGREGNLFHTEENLNKVLQSHDVYTVKKIIELFKAEKILSQNTFNIACETVHDDDRAISITHIFEQAKSDKQFDLVLKNLKEVCQYAGELNSIFSIILDKDFDGFTFGKDNLRRPKDYCELVLKNVSFAKQIYEELNAMQSSFEDSNFFRRKANSLSGMLFKELLLKLNYVSPKLISRICKYPPHYSKPMIKGMLRLLRLPLSCPEDLETRIEAIFKAPQNTEAIIELIVKMEHHWDPQLGVLHAEECAEIKKAVDALERSGNFCSSKGLKLFKNAEYAVKATSLFSYLPVIKRDSIKYSHLTESHKYDKLLNELLENAVHLEGIEKELKELSASKIEINADILQKIIDKQDASNFKCIFLLGKHPHCEKSNVFKFFGKNRDGGRNNVLSSDKPLAIIQSFLKKS